jgi:hypothetical protein
VRQSDYAEHRQRADERGGDEDLSACGFHRCLSPYVF